jgi:hypothetical protein
MEFDECRQSKQVLLQSRLHTSLKHYAVLFLIISPFYHEIT